MKKFSLLVIFLISTSTKAEADPATPIPVEVCIRSAPIIVLAEDGKTELDDLKEGAEIKSTLSKFYSRKQEFKILKVYRNASDTEMKVGTVISVPPPYNNCDDYDLKVSKKSGKMQITPLNGMEPYLLKVNKGGNKVVLFLEPIDFDRGRLSYYSPDGKPEAFNQDWEAKLAHLPSYVASRSLASMIDPKKFENNPEIGNIAPYRREMLAKLAINWKSIKPDTKSKQFSVLLIDIAKSGKVISVSVEKSAGTLFDNAALKAVAATRFSALPNWFRDKSIPFKTNMAKVDELCK